MDQENKGNLHGIIVDCNAPAISHLMYVDDLLVMCQANEGEAEVVKNCLNKYCSWVEQEINTNKSCNFSSKNTSLRDKRNIKDRMNIKEMRQQAIYLENSLVFGKSMTKEFHHLKEKVQNRLQGWTANLLSKAGKATLIKSVAQAIPTYVMSYFLLPKSLSTDLDGIIR